MVTRRELEVSAHVFLLLGTTFMSAAAADLRDGLVAHWEFRRGSEATIVETRSLDGRRQLTSLCVALRNTAASIGVVVDSNATVITRPEWTKWETVWKACEGAGVKPATAMISYRAVPRVPSMVSTSGLCFGSRQDHGRTSRLTMGLPGQGHLISGNAHRKEGKGGDTTMSAMSPTKIP